MNSLAIGLVGLCILSAIGMMSGCRAIRKKEREMVQRLRTSNMYKSLYRSVSRLGDYAVD